MGRINQYQQDKLASSLLGTPGVDHSGQMIAQSALGSAEGLANTSVSLQGQSNQVVEHSIGQVASEVHHELMVRQAMQNAIHSKQAEMASENNAASAAADAQIQDHALRTDILANANGKYANDDLNKIYEDGHKRITDSMQSRFQDSNGKTIDPNGYNMFNQRMRPVLVGGANEMTDTMSSRRLAAADNQIDNNFKNQMDVASAAKGSPAELLPALTALDTMKPLVTNRHGLKVGPGMLVAQKQKLLLNSIDAGITDARDTTAARQQAGGNFLQGTEIQAGKLKQLEGYINTDFYKNNVTPTALDEKRNSLRVAIDAVARDHETNIENSHAKDYGAVSLSTNRALNAVAAQDGTGALAALAPIDSIIAAQSDLSASDHDPTLLNKALSAKREVISVIQGIGHAAEAKVKAGQAESDRLVGEQRTIISDTEARDKQIETARNAQLKAALDSPQGLAANAKLKVEWGALHAKYAATPVNADGYAEGTGITAKDIQGFGTRISDAAAHGYLTRAEAISMQVNLDNIRKAVIPTDLKEGRHHNFDIRDLNVFDAQMKGASPTLKGFLNVADGTTAARNLDSEVATELERIMSRPENFKELGKSEVPVINAMHIANAKVIAEQRVAKRYYEAHQSTYQMPPIALPPIKPIKEIRATVTKAGSPDVPPPPPNAGPGIVIGANQGEAKVPGASTAFPKNQKLNAPPEPQALTPQLDEGGK